MSHPLESLELVGIDGRPATEWERDRIGIQDRIDNFADEQEELDNRQRHVTLLDRFNAWRDERAARGKVQTLKGVTGKTLGPEHFPYDSEADAVGVNMQEYGMLVRENGDEEMGPRNLSRNAAEVVFEAQAERRRQEAAATATPERTKPHHRSRTSRREIRAHK